MAAQVTRLYMWKSVETKLCVDLNEKKDNGCNDDKKEDEFYLSSSITIMLEQKLSKSFNIHPSICVQSPVIDDYTPPPDVTTAV
jgi:hypothetical protein